MFKGQGCNQTLADAVLLADWIRKPGLTRQNLSTRLRCYEREMIARVHPRVLASREAAYKYHSEAALSAEYGFEGVEEGELDEFLSQMKGQGINASWGDALEPALVKILSSFREKRE